MQIDILNPKATRLLKDLADMDLIAIRDIADDGFMDAVNAIRAKANTNPPSMEEITEEVEKVRAERHARSKRQSNH
jgi:hypothetical protein